MLKVIIYCGDNKCRTSITEMDENGKRISKQVMAFKNIRLKRIIDEGGTEESKAQLGGMKQGIRAKKMLKSKVNRNEINHS